MNKKFTLAEVEQLLSSQGCCFNIHHGRHPDNGFPVVSAEREITDGKERIFFYFGRKDEYVSRSFLEEVCKTLVIDRSLFGLTVRALHRVRSPI